MALGQWLAQGYPVSTRLSGYALPRDRQDKRRGSAEKNVGRVQPAEQLRIWISVFSVTPNTKHARSR